MYTRKRFKLLPVLKIGWPALALVTIWSSLVTAAFSFGGCSWLAIPALPVSVLGTAVSFYLGFKGNASYGRLWEARKIWGGIVNTSRTWGTHAINFTQDTHSQARQELLYRHVAWLNALHVRLRRPKPWEHRRPFNDTYRKTVGTLDVSDKRLRDVMEGLLSPEELDAIMQKKNHTTQLLHAQSTQLKALHEAGAIDNFRHMELAKLIETLFTLQGKCERIKNFPLPRQYATANHWFVCCFIALVPLAMLGTFASTDLPVVLTVPVSVLLGWVFHTWDAVLEYSENPFEGLINDIPMVAMSRTIEIDLREMLGESDLPEALGPVDSVLM